MKGIYSKMYTRFDWSCYTGNLDWLKDRTIYMSVHGSMAYGTNLPTSDVDIRGVCVAPKEYYLGYDKNFEQAIQNNPDITIFELRKFIKLASNCNPNVLEVLYTDESDHLIKSHLGQKLLYIRDLFISKKAKATFQGYACAQMKRIELHRKYITNPITRKPERKEFGLPDKNLIPKDQFDAANALIESKLNNWRLNCLTELEQDVRQNILDELEDIICEINNCNYKNLEDTLWLKACNAVGFESNFIEYIKQEKLYSTKLKEWKNYQEWLKNRNPLRAELETKYHYDCKHAMHLIRLLLMCDEILSSGKVIVKRPDAEFLLEVRNGRFTIDELMDWVKNQEDKIKESFNKSKLPNSPNTKLIDCTCIDIIEQML